MLSSITPMTEAGRGNRFSVTAAWFVVGGVVGGVSIGALAALGSGLVALTDPSDTVRWGVAAVAAVVCAGIDLGAFGIELPIFKRQVNDAWLRRYRSWVYGAGFGWQIGFGVATYIMTAGVFLTIALAVLSASPVSAVAIGAAFGLVRGLAVYVGRTGTTPAALGHIHERLDALGPPSRAAAAGSQVLAATVLAAISLGAWASLVVLALAVAAVALNARSHGNRPAAA
jgi:MFS family permease